MVRPTNTDCAVLVCLKPCRIAQITFGGKSFWDGAEGEHFLFTGILEVNESFTVVHSGLNIYVYETSKIRVL